MVGISRIRSNVLTLHFQPEVPRDGIEPPLTAGKRRCPNLVRIPNFAIRRAGQATRRELNPRAILFAPGSQPGSANQRRTLVESG